MGKDKRNSHGQRIRREERQSKRDQDQQLDSKAICKACVSPAWIVANLEGQWSLVCFDSLGDNFALAMRK